MIQNLSSAQTGEYASLEDGLESLRTGAEFGGPVESLGGHRCNDHFAHIYETDEEKFDAAIPFVRHGLERGERVMYVVDETTEASVRAALRAAGVDVDDALESGALSFHTVRETYLRNGSFDVDDALAFYDDTAAAATEEYGALRIVAETTWLTDEAASIEQFMEYEQKINRLFDRTDSLAICQYDRRRFDPETIRTVVRTHPHLIYDGAVCHNFYYTPPGEFFGADAPDRENDRMLRTLRDRTEAKATLRRRERFLERLYEITADSAQSFDEKVERLLELGRERFGLDVGYVCLTADAFEVVSAVGDHDLIRPGVTGSLDGTYCEKLLGSAGSLAVRDAAAEGWADDPAYEQFGLDTYFATTVTGGEEYGTLCFASESPRDRPYSDAERTFLDLMGQWLEYELERGHRETRLHALNGISRELLDAGTPEEIAAGVVDAVADASEAAAAAVALYDEETGELRPAAHTAAAADVVETAGLFDRGDGAAWSAFVEGEPKRIADPVRRPDAPDGRASALSEVVVYPLGTHAVYLVGSRTPGGFRSDDLEAVETGAANIRAALDRTDRERKLQRREDALEAQNETLERLNRINDTIRSIDRALVEASTREEIERVVCEEFAHSGPYELAWVGSRDGATDEITPRESAGADKGYLDGITVTTDETPTGNGPAGRAFATGEAHVVNDVLTDESFEPWRQAALERGYHASASFPLRYNDTRYGVLNLYAGQPGVFDDLEREVLTELSNTVAHAINAIESKKALFSDTVTELEFAVTGEDLGVVELADELGCEFSMKRLVTQSGGGVRGFFALDGASVEDVLAFESRLPVTELQVVSDDPDSAPVFQAALSDESIATAVIDHGGKLVRFDAADGTAAVTVTLAADAAVREFVEMFRYKYPNAELRAQRTRELAGQTALEFAAELTGELTDRQREVVQTAYYNGYFEQPRNRTGTEIAETMGISQPTFHAHVRTAVRKLCRGVFDDESTVGGHSD